MSSGHVLIMCKLPCIINDDHIFLSFGMYLPGQSSCHLYMACQLLQNMASGHIKVKKGTGHVFYMATASNAIESVHEKIILVDFDPIGQMGSFVTLGVIWDNLYQFSFSILHFALKLCFNIFIISYSKDLALSINPECLTINLPMALLSTS